MGVIRRVHVPLQAPEDIIPHLGAPHHWREGRSAKCLVDQWWHANDIPLSVRSILEQAPEWRDAELLDGFAERCTSLGDGRPSHSQSDLLAVVGLNSGIGILTIEAKVDEGFDKTIDEWLKADSAGKRKRLEGLCARFGFNSQQVGEYRYQLFHRTASALIEAERYRSSQAAMIVQSWCPKNSSLEDYTAFCRLLGYREAEVGALTEPKMFQGIALRLGWSAESMPV